MNQVVCEGTRTARTPAVGRALRPRKKDFARSGARFFREASHNKFPDFSVYPLHTFPICPLPPGSGLSQFPNLPASSGKRAFPISQFARFLREAGVPSSPHCPLSPGSEFSQLSNLPASSWKRAFPVSQFARFLREAGLIKKHNGGGRTHDLREGSQPLPAKPVKTVPPGIDPEIEFRGKGIFQNGVIRSRTQEAVYRNRGHYPRDHTHKIKKPNAFFFCRYIFDTFF